MSYLNNDNEPQQEKYRYYQQQPPAQEQHNQYPTNVYSQQQYYAHLDDPMGSGNDYRQASNVHPINVEEPTAQTAMAWRNSRENSNHNILQEFPQTYQHPPATQFLGADESVMMAQIEKDLPIPSSDAKLDESTYNEYASSQAYYPTFNGNDNSLYPANQIPTHSQNHHPEQPIMEITYHQPNIFSSPKVMSSDPLVLQNQRHTTQAQRQSKLYDEIEPLRRRKFCCCFRRRNHCILFFALLFVLFLVLLFLALPFQFFGFDASDPFLLPDSASRLQLASINPLSLSFSIGEDITVYSPSYFAWGIREVNVQMNLKSTDGVIIPGFVGSGSQQNLRFPARSSTVFTLVSF